MSTWRKLLLAVVALNVVLLGARWAWLTLASDQTKIRWRIEAMVDGFNACRTGRVLDGIAPDFRDQASGATRDDLHAGLVQLFFERVDSRTHKFQLHAELLVDELEIHVEDAEPPQATANVHVLIDEHTGDTTTVFWDARVEGRLRKTDDGWKWIETTRVNHRERSRGR